MPANLPVSPNAATIQGASPDGATGYPVAVVPAAGAAPFDVNILAGGGGAVTIADGADVCEGATTDAAVASDAAGTVNAHLRGLVKILSDVWNSAKHWLKVSINNADPLTVADFVGFPDTPNILAFGYRFNRRRNQFAREEGNNHRLLLTSAARTTTQVVTDIFQPTKRSLVLVVYVTAPGTGTLTPSIQIREDIFGTYQTIWTAAAAIPATPGYYLYYFADGAGAGGAYTEVIPRGLPQDYWQLTLTKSDGTLWTFGAGVGYS